MFEGVKVGPRVGAFEAIAVGYTDGIRDGIIVGFLDCAGLLVVGLLGNIVGRLATADHIENIAIIRKNIYNF